MTTYQWSDIAFKDKSALKKDGLVFVAGSREISPKRIGQIIKEYINKGPILWGTLTDSYIEGFSGQPQFRTLSPSKLSQVLGKVATMKLPNPIDSIEYSQSELPYILDKIDFAQALFINGSWKFVFHTTKVFTELARKRTKYKLISPFSSDDEAKSFEASMVEKIAQSTKFDNSKRYSEVELIGLAAAVSARSYDYTWQTGCVLAIEGRVVETGHNMVLPYETFAMHHGSLREKFYTPPNDLNNYDTIHAEMVVIEKMLRRGASLKGTTLYVNLMPCPTCAKLLALTDIEEIVYTHDHSEGYSFKLFESMGKKIRRVVA